MAFRKIYQKTQVEGSPKNVAKVHFSQHFPKDFLRPYGNATERTVAADADFKRKLQPFTCEWLCRPSVAASELAATMDENLEKFNDVKLLASATEHIDNMKSKLESVSEGFLIYFLHICNALLLNIYLLKTFTFQH